MSFFKTRVKLTIIPVILIFILPLGLAGQNNSQLIQDSNPNSIVKMLPSQITSGAFKSIEDYINGNEENQSEKIFLHPDRPDYMPGDTIWFKAYLWYGYDQLPDTLSGILYVDLINAEDSVILKRKLLIQNGSSFGNFCLDSTLIPGTYRIIAYTRYMFNSNSGEPFYQNIIINPERKNFHFEFNPVIIKQTGGDSLELGFRFFELDRSGDLNNNFRHNLACSLKIGRTLLKSDSIRSINTRKEVLKYSLAGIGKADSIAEFEVEIKDDRLTFNKKFHIPLREGIDLQFLPEGGTLVTGLESKIAFKAIGTDGLSREVEGEIKTMNERVVCTFKSLHKGIGTFRLTPEMNEKYFAHFWYKNQKYKIPLPPVSEKGSVISICRTGKNQEPYLSIKKYPSVDLVQKYIVGSSYGKIWFSAAINSLKDSCRLRIPLELLPEGVCRLTLLSADFHPECERLIFVDKQQRIKIEVTPDSSAYAARSEVNLAIKAKYLDGTPAMADLSIAVVDKEQISETDNGYGIKAFKLLESELHGKIEDPASWFRDDTIMNQPNLDLLLLTNGYRRFLVDRSDTKGLKYIPEKSFDISGQLKFEGNKVREKKLNYNDISITLLTKTHNSYIALSKPDNQGRFTFQIPLRNGNCKSLLQATTLKGKPFNGEISLNHPGVLPLFYPPASSNFANVSPVIENVNRVHSEMKTEISKLSLPGSMSKTLNEVVVTAKANPGNWWHNYDKDALMIAKLDSLDPSGDTYMSLNDLLCKEFGAKKYVNANVPLETVLLPCVQNICEGPCLLKYFPIYVIDGRIYWNGKDFDFTPLNTLSAYRVNEIKRILVIPPGKSIAMYYAYDPIIGFPQFILQSLVIIETYPDSHYYRGDPPGVKTFILEGLDEPRAFYSPCYEGQEKNNPVYDGRVTLYWNPSVKTDINGEAKVGFYTSDRMTKIKVTINGMDSANGYPGEGSGVIEVNARKN